MNYLIIIRGALGVGKTIIAKKLAEILPAEYISVDLVLRGIGLHKVEGECIPLKNYLEADKKIIPLAKEYLNNGKNVVIEGCFYFKEQIKDLLGNLGNAHFKFTLKAPLEVCAQRDKQRKKSYGQEAAAAVLNLVNKFDYGITINTENKTINDVINEIKGYLPL